ncbi:MAG: hypothetical protein ABEK02_03505 [Haloquadratum sp.]
MSESLRVELNAGAVHAVDAPEEFTAHGPFHVELVNAGGPCHVHLHFDDDLSRVARLPDVNHYVGEEQTNRVPVGTTSARGPVTGRLKIVAGYGAETRYVTVTVVPQSDGSARRSAASGASLTAARDESGGGDAGPTDGGAGTRPSEPGESGDSGDPEETAERPRRTAAGGTATHSHAERRGRAGSDRAAGAAGSLARSDLTVPAVLARAGAAVRSVSRDGLAFATLTIVALAVALAVIVAVRDLLLSLVVLGIAGVIAGTAGYLLFR